MNRYGVTLLLKEFPFLNELCSKFFSNENMTPIKIDEIRIDYGDDVLLGKKGNENTYKARSGTQNDFTKYIAVYEHEGENIFDLLLYAGHEKTCYARDIKWEADTIGEQLMLKKIFPNYIVEWKKEDTDHEYNGQLKVFWTIYKMNDFDLVGYHSRQLDKAAEELKAEIAEACEKFNQKYVPGIKKDDIVIIDSDELFTKSQ